VRVAVGFAVLALVLALLLLLTFVFVACFAAFGFVWAARVGAFALFAAFLGTDFDAVFFERLGFIARSYTRRDFSRSTAIRTPLRGFLVELP
jgi:hypothetical protein